MLDLTVTDNVNPKQFEYKSDYYRPRNEASEGCVFTGVCHSVILGGGWATPKVNPPPTWDMVKHPSPAHLGHGQPPSPPHLGHGQIPPPPGTWSTPPPQAGGMHPTGMHSCFTIVICQTHLELLCFSSDLHITVNMKKIID